MRPARLPRPRAGIRAAVLATLLSLMLPTGAFAVPASTFLAPEALATLMAGQSLRSSELGKGASLVIAPCHPEADRLRAELAAEKPDVVVEALFMWKKPRSAPVGTELLAAYNVMRSIGSLAGIEYYSASRKKMRLFYESSTIVSGPDGKTPVGDTALAALPRSETLYARQKDLSFGDNVYRYEFSSGPDYLRSLSVNLTTMRYGIIPVAGPNDLRVRTLAIFTDEAIIFYAVSSAKAAVIPGVRAKLENSFGNRAEAIYAWFSRRAAQEWQALP